MAKPQTQQIVISGIGGQGVLFVTRLLAEAAIARNLPVFTSETHGMAQRGGTVVSHLKVGPFSSPLIRPAQADGLLALKAENMAQHGDFVKENGWAVVNSRNSDGSKDQRCTFEVNADALAQQHRLPKAVNLILLGYALALGRSQSTGGGLLFCTYEDVTAAAISMTRQRRDMREASLKALEIGYQK